MTQFDDELLAGLGPEERERLRRVHELLLRANPPPELPPGLERPPDPSPPARLLPRRRRPALALVAAALAAAAFGAGYLAGGRGGVDVDRTLAMSGPGGARASLALLEVDEAGNWPMRLTALGLPEGSYELWLTKDGRLAAPCGRFRVSSGKTEVLLNAPYRLRRFDGWVVVRAGSERVVLTT